jgi:parvulin-like peptidyl-prolyl isomerase
MKKYLLAIFIFLPQFCYAIENKIVAIVGQDIITKSDLENRYALVILTNKEAKKADQKSLKEQILQSLINEKIFSQEAKRLQLIPTQDEIDNNIRDIEIRQQMAKGDLLKKLKADGIPSEAFITQIRNGLIWDKLLANIVMPSIEVSNEELLNFIANNQPDKVHIDGYLVSVNHINTDKEYDQLKKFWNKSQSCSTFKRAEANKPETIKIEHFASTLNSIQNLKAKKLISDMSQDQTSLIYNDDDKMNFLVLCNKKYDMTTRDMSQFDNIIRQRKIAVQAEYYVENLRKKKFVEVYYLNGK